MAFSFASTYNVERKFEIDTSEFEYRNLEDIYVDDDDIYTIRGVYINTNSKYGPAPVLAIDDCYVNLPSHLLDTCKAMINDARAVDAINRSKAGFKIYQYYQKRFNKMCYGVRWVDID